MTPAEAARAVIVAGWAAGVALIIAGWAAAYAVAVLTLVTAGAVVLAWRGGVLLKAARQIVPVRRILRRARTESALDRT